MARRESTKPGDKIKTFQFPVFIHNSPFTASAEEGITQIICELQIWKSGHPAIQNIAKWHLQYLEVSEDGLRQLHNNQRRFHVGRPFATKAVKLGAMICLYKQGIDPLQVKGLIAKASKPGIYGHCRPALRAFEEWRAAQGKVA